MTRGYFGLMIPFIFPGVFLFFFHMNNKIYLTKEGSDKIKKELEDLQNVIRPRVVERLSSARMQGDLSENAEYASARDELAFVDGRIEELEEIIKNSAIVQKSAGPCDCVVLGCKVKVKSGGAENVFHIVGEWEANPAEKKVSHTSPLGQALIGKKVGEEVEFEAPAGKILFKILGIE